MLVTHQIWRGVNTCCEIPRDCKTFWSIAQQQASLANYRVQNLLLEAMIVRGSRAAVCRLEVIIPALMRMWDFHNEMREIEGQGLVHVGLDGWR